MSAVPPPEPLAWRVKLPRVGGGWHWVLNSHPLDEFQNEPLVTLEAALAYGAACAAEQREDIRTLIMAKHYASQHQHNLYHCLAVELFGDAAIRASAMPEPEPGAETDTRHTAQSPVSPTDAP